MQRLTMADVTPLDEYRERRPKWRQRLIEVRATRRVAVGDRLSVNFENRDTLLYQVEEMVYAEQMQDRDQVQGELDAYNDLLPGSGELSATLFIEIPNQAFIKEELRRFVGIEDAVALEFPDGTRVPGEPAEHRSLAESTASVHYLRFRLGDAGTRAFLGGRGHVAVVVDHPNYRRRAVLTDAAWESLAADLQS